MLLGKAVVGLLVAAKNSPYKMTPDMRLSRRALPGESFRDGIALADRALEDLSRCLKD